MSEYVRSRKISAVGEFIKKHRQALKLSQKELGQKFTPPVTTQFISNIERGVTPLPLVHVSILAQAIQVDEAEIRLLLERDYSLKLAGRISGLGASAGGSEPSVSPLAGSLPPPLHVAEKDYGFMAALYSAYQVADLQTQKAFAAVAETMLQLKK
jgi:hypothetical protein